MTEEDTAPVDLTAPANPRTQGVAAGVEVEWDPVPGATGYEVRVDGGWVEVGETTTYLDTDAPLGRLAGTLTADASDATERDHVTLTATLDVSAVPGDPRTTFTWQRATDDPPTIFEDLPDATTPTHLDTTAPPDGSRTTYRIVASAEGASNEIESDGDEGWRLAAMQVGVGAAHEDDDLDRVLILLVFHSLVGSPERGAIDAKDITETALRRSLRQRIAQLFESLPGPKSAEVISGCPVSLR